MGRQLFEAPTTASDVDIRLRRLEARVARLEAALARVTEVPSDPVPVPAPAR
jgi:hypothetical protein